MQPIRTALSAIAIASLTLTSPAAAGNGNKIGPGEVLAGLVALGVIAAVIDNANDKNSPAPVNSANVYKVKPVYPAQPVYPKTYRPLPRHCLRNAVSDNQAMKLYGRHCLSQANFPVSDFPKVCETTVRAANQNFTGYRAQCLLNRGYRVARY
ncbi:MAG: hypothetical protein ACWA5A_18095 [Marinibacterium sp.]